MIDPLGVFEGSREVSTEPLDDDIQLHPLYAHILGDGLERLLLELLGQEEAHLLVVDAALGLLLHAGGDGDGHLHPDHLLVPPRDVARQSGVHLPVAGVGAAGPSHVGDHTRQGPLTANLGSSSKCLICPNPGRPKTNKEPTLSSPVISTLPLVQAHQAAGYFLVSIP